MTPTGPHKGNLCNPWGYCAERPFQCSRQVTGQQLAERCRGRIATDKDLRDAFFADDFPMTGSGKLRDDGGSGPPLEPDIVRWAS